MCLGSQHGMAEPGQVETRRLIRAVGALRSQIVYTVQDTLGIEVSVGVLDPPLFQPAGRKLTAPRQPPTSA